jgi:hypothetical protein
MSILNEYLSQIYNVVSYTTNPHNPLTCRKTILVDTMKCTLIGTVLAMMIRYSIGECYYLKYGRIIIRGALFGLCYSFYFTNQKVETFEARKKLGLMEIDNAII